MSSPVRVSRIGGDNREGLEHIADSAAAHLAGRLEDAGHQVVELVHLLIEVLERSRSHLTLIPNCLLAALDVLNFSVERISGEGLFYRRKLDDLALSVGRLQIDRTSTSMDSFDGSSLSFAFSLSSWDASTKSPR